MKRLLILLAVLMIASVSYGENGPSPLITPSSVSGLGTIATVNSPVPVANGGTGATTAATGLAALGTQPWTAGEKTQALVGSTTVNILAKKLNGLYGVKFVTLGAGESVAVNSLFGDATNSYYGQIKITCISSAGGFATFWATGSSVPALVSEYPTGLCAVTDTAGKICVFFSGTYLLKNNQAGARDFIVERL